MSTVFPRIGNTERMRVCHGSCWRLMAAVKRQASVRDLQTRKVNLTRLTADWKGTTLGAQAALGALRVAAESLRREDIIAAYREMGRFIGAEFIERTVMPQETAP